MKKLDRLQVIGWACPLILRLRLQHKKHLLNSRALLRETYNSAYSQMATHSAFELMALSAMYTRRATAAAGKARSGKGGTRQGRAGWERVG